jgi:hypothetical protein
VKADQRPIEYAAPQTDIVEIRRHYFAPFSVASPPKPENRTASSIAKTVASLDHECHPALHALRSPPHVMRRRLIYWAQFFDTAQLFSRAVIASVTRLTKPKTPRRKQCDACHNGLTQMVKMAPPQSSEGDVCRCFVALKHTANPR